MFAPSFWGYVFAWFSTASPLMSRTYFLVMMAPNVHTSASDMIIYVSKKCSGSRHENGRAWFGSVLGSMNSLTLNVSVLSTPTIQTIGKVISSLGVDSC